jgi:hypothetical protein
MFPSFLKGAEVWKLYWQEQSFIENKQMVKKQKWHIFKKYINL